MSSCTNYRTTILSVGPAPKKYQREICATSYATHCPIHGDLEVRATESKIGVMSDNKVSLGLMIN